VPFFDIGTSSLGNTRQIVDDNEQRAPEALWRWPPGGQGAERVRMGASAAPGESVEVTSYMDLDAIVP
jgi:hypothetical protein